MPDGHLYRITSNGKVIKKDNQIGKKGYGNQAKKSKQFDKGDDENEQINMDTDRNDKHEGYE
jgi:hypothetical protein